MAATRSRSNLPGMDCDIVQEKVAAVSAIAGQTGFDPTAFTRPGVAGARDGVRESRGTEAGKLLSGNPLLTRTMPANLATKTVHQLGYKAKEGRSGLARGRGHGAIGTGTGHLCARTLTYSARKTPYDKPFEVGTSARSCRAGGCAASPCGAGTTMTSAAESMFEMTNKIAGEQRPARIADIIVLHS
jgi:hypothetical protein